MFDQVALWLEQYPYLGAAILFLLCGMGLPLPEEIVLLAGGYVCAKWPDNATLWVMMLWCGGAILVGDLIPFVLGRTFGTRLLRVRWMRMLVTKRRLAMFDRWFRRRGDMVILIARFIAGLRVVIDSSVSRGTIMPAQMVSFVSRSIRMNEPVVRLRVYGSNASGLIDSS